MANIKPISMGSGSKLNFKKSTAKSQSVKPEFRDDFVASDWKPIDYNVQLSELSKDNNIGSVGDINKDGKIDQYDVSTLQEYLSLGDGEKLAFAAERGHMFETGRILRKYKDRADLGELIHLAYKGEELQTVEFTADGTYGVSSEDVAEGNAIIREIREAFTQDEYNVGETGINKFMSVYDGKDLYYDINGDGKVNANDVTALQKYNQIIDNKNNDKNATKDSRLNYSGNFSNFTDFQNVQLNAIDFLQYITSGGMDANLLKGKTISESVAIMEDYIENKIGPNGEGYKYYNGMFKDYKTLIDRGFGNYKIVEVVREGSMDAIVLQDMQGNYRIYYNGTQSMECNPNPDLGDYLFDARNVVETQFVNGWVDSLLEDTFEKAGKVAGGTGGGVAGGVIGLLFGGPAGALIGGTIGATSGSAAGGAVGSAIYKQAISAVRNGIDPDKHPEVISFIEERLNYLDLSEPMKNQIMYAVKHGGLNGQYNSQKEAAHALALKYYNQAVSEGKKLSFQGYSLGGGHVESAYLSLCDKPGANNVIDGLVLTNPYHDNLTSEQAAKVKSAKGFEMYCGEGDMVSTVFNYDDFKDDAKYLYLDYESALTSDDEGFKVGNLNLSNFAGIFGTTHMLQPYLYDNYHELHGNEAFAEDGSVKTHVSYTDPEKGSVSRDVHSHSFAELNSHLFNGQGYSNVDELGKALVGQAASSYLGVNLTDGDLEDPTKVIINTGKNYVKNKVVSTGANFCLNMITWWNNTFNRNEGGASSDF